MKEKQLQEKELKEKIERKKIEEDKGDKEDKEEKEDKEDNKDKQDKEDKDEKENKTTKEGKITRNRKPSHKKIESDQYKQYLSQYFDESSEMIGDEGSDEDYNPQQEKLEQKSSQKEKKEKPIRQSQVPKKSEGEGEEYFLFTNCFLTPNFQKNFSIFKYTLDENKVTLEVKGYNPKSTFEETPFKLSLFQKPCKVWEIITAQKLNKTTPFSRNFKNSIFFKETKNNNQESSMKLIKEKVEKMEEMSQTQESFLYKNISMRNITFLKSETVFGEETQIGDEKNSEITILGKLQGF